MSVTTDGFITDLVSLEELLLKQPEQCYLLRSYRNLRKQLSDSPNALEIKNEGSGIVS